MSAPRIVEAVGVGFPLGGAVHPAARVAMIRAVEQAQREGITDPDILRARLLAARTAAIVSRED